MLLCSLINLLSFFNMTPEKLDCISRSMVLNKMIECLQNELHVHMLYWDDKENNVFVVRFVHRSSPEWSTADLDLFKELDRVDPEKYKEYLQDQDYEKQCKQRCYANLRKLCNGKANNGPLKFIGEIKEGKSIRLRKYKINVEGISNAKNSVSKGAKVTKRSTQNHLGKYGTVQKVPYKDKFVMKTLPNKQSHYLCLSNLNPIILIALPVGASLSRDIALLTNCAESLNSDYQLNGKSALPIDDNLAVAMGTGNADSMQYEFSIYNQLQPGNTELIKFQDIASPTNCAESLNSDYQLNGKSAFPIDDNLAVAMGTGNADSKQYESLGYNQLQPGNTELIQFQVMKRRSVPDVIGPSSAKRCRKLSTTFESSAESDIALLTNCAESLNSDYQLNGKSALPIDGNLAVAMCTGNADSEQYQSLGCNQLQPGNTELIQFQNEAFQDLDKESKNCEQTVPSSPLEWNGISNDLSGWEMDIKPLQQDDDPFLSSTMPNCLSNYLMGENGRSLSDAEDCFVFENIFE